jgi:hypothetical protein
VRHVTWWLRFWAKCSVATWLVHTATGLGWLQSLAALSLFLWAGVEAVRVLARLLRAMAPEPDDGGGEGPGAGLPIVITTDAKQKIARNMWRS